MSRNENMLLYIYIYIYIYIVIVNKFIDTNNNMLSCAWHDKVIIVYGYNIQYIKI